VAGAIFPRRRFGFLSPTPLARFVQVDDLAHTAILHPFSDEDEMGKTIELIAADGHAFSAYQDGPADAKRGLVVVQEIFGVNRHMRHVCNQFAHAGYAVISPALFDRAERGVELGYEQADVQRGLALRSQVPEDGVMADIIASAKALEGRPIGIIGYCWGGTVAWWGATRATQFSAAVGWYGGGIAASRTATPNCPVQLHFGGVDQSIPVRDVEAIRDAQPDLEIFVYDDAGHGFGCEERASYRAQDAELAQSRTLEFFAANLR
jgi:carboxymethylenebutenolidase